MTSNDNRDVRVGRARGAAAVCLMAWATLGQADDGKWTPQQVHEQGPAWIQARGFTVPLEKLWDPKTATGLLANAVALPGCTGSFVSTDGLIITNHHCVSGILQEHSTPEQDLFERGFLARSRHDEKKAAAFRISVPAGFEDVTAAVQAAVPEGASDLERYLAVERKRTALVTECEREPNTRCQAAVFDGGLFFVLARAREIADVRLVYAPPRAVGEYGGEVDNWRWPRHTGDFALIRAYGADGIPYRPSSFFPVSTEGVKEGDAVAVLGYPGTSFRALLADEMDERARRFFPALESIAGEWIEILEDESARRDTARVAVADTIKSLANRMKNAQGQQVGIRRGQILEKQRAAEEAVVAWLEGRPEAEAARRARDELRAIAAERERTWDRDFLLALLAASGPGTLPAPLGPSWAVTIARTAHEAGRPDHEREPAYQERERQRLRERLDREQKRFDGTADARTFAAWVARMRALPAPLRSPAVEATFAGADTKDAILARVQELYGQTRVTDRDERRAMLDLATEALRARRDALLDFGLALDAERRELKERDGRAAGASYRLRPAWRRAVIAFAGRPLAPDANTTLRVTFGRVRGYTPRDGVAYTPHTRLSGAVDKHTGQAPFDLPGPVLAAAREGRRGRFVDAALEDVPVAFLADSDTTGGNSGSPVVDGRGRLVGVNFDRVWENVANDFGYNPEVARHISVDVRYLLWMLEEVEKAKDLVAEMTRGAR